MPRLRLKKPKALLFDISGTVAKTSFIDKILLPYISDKYRSYMDENWDTKQVKLDLEVLQQESNKDTNPDAPKFNRTGNKQQDIDSSYEYVKYCLQNQIDNKGMTLLRFHMWFDAYNKDLLETPVYSDVAIQIQKWRCDQNIKLYVFSNGWSEATRRFLSKTNHGDLNLLIDGHFDTSLGQLTDPKTFEKVLEKINEKTSDVVFLTKSAEEGRAACQIGLTVCLVLTHRRDIERLDEEGKKMPRVRSFNEIEFEE